MLDRGFAFYEREADARRRRAAACSSASTRARRSASAAAGWRARACTANAARAVAAGLGRARAQRAAAAVRLRPRHGPPGGHHARLQHRDRADQPAARSRTAASSSARLFDGDQDVAAGIGGRPPAAFGAARARPLRPARPGHAAPDATRGDGRAPAADPRAVRRRRERRGALGPGVRRAVPRPAGDRHGAPARRRRAHAPPLHGRVHREHAGRCARAGRAARRTVDVLFPSWGRGAARVVAVGRRRAAAAVGRRRIALAGVAWFHVRSAARRLRGRPAARPRARPPTYSPPAARRPRPTRDRRSPCGSRAASASAAPR